MKTTECRSVEILVEVSVSVLVVSGVPLSGARVSAPTYVDDDSDEVFVLELLDFDKSPFLVNVRSS